MCRMTTIYETPDTIPQPWRAYVPPKENREKLVDPLNDQGSKSTFHLEM